ncbi:MAG: MmcB family DNA repair protein [Anaerolineaceae bacterium]|nr:MmcB family DNA repair protein [Anaerolineaceae bacterium]
MIVAEDIKGLLAQRHLEDVFVAECRIHGEAWEAEGYMDAWAMKKSWHSPSTYGYEVKVSRRDFMQDNKWPKYLPFCNYFSFVAPTGVIKEEEVPEGVGLILVAKGGSKLYTKRKAPRREIESGALESLYKSILMSRVRILDKSSFGADPNASQRKRWEEFIAAKEENRAYGMWVRGKLRQIYREKIEKVGLEIRKIKLENENLQNVKKLLDKYGISQGWQAERDIESLVDGKEAEDLRRSLELLKRQADNIIGMLKI